MRYRLLGNTGLQVSEIGLGAVEIGMDYGLAEPGRTRRPPEAEAVRLIHAALDMGINLIDTAHAYGESEALIGRALKDRPGRCIIATKCLARPPAEGTSPTLAQEITESVDLSLRRLGVECLDIVQLHNATVALLERGDAMDALERLQQAGKIRFLAGSTYGEPPPLKALEDGRIRALQVPYSVLNQQMAERVLVRAHAQGVGILARSVLAKGALSGRAHLLPPELEPLRRHIEDLAGRCAPLHEFAIRFVLSHPAVSTVLIGTGKLAHLESAVRAAARGPLTAAELAAALAAAADPALADTTRF